MFAVRGSAGVQRALQPDAAHARAHGRAALRLQGVREGLPAGEHALPPQDHPHSGKHRDGSDASWIYNLGTFRGINSTVPTFKTVREPSGKHREPSESRQVNTESRQRAVREPSDKHREPSENRGTPVQRAGGPRFREPGDPGSEASRTNGPSCGLRPPGSGTQNGPEMEAGAGRVLEPCCRRPDGPSPTLSLLVS